VNGGGAVVGGSGEGVLCWWAWVQSFVTQGTQAAHEGGGHQPKIKFTPVQQYLLSSGCLFPPPTRAAVEGHHSNLVRVTVCCQCIMLLLGVWWLQVVVTPGTQAAVSAAAAAGRSCWRVSSTLFSHIASDVTLEPLEGFSSSSEQYAPIKAGQQVCRRCRLFGGGDDLEGSESRH
jgi:hypothetical protein